MLCEAHRWLQGNYCVKKPRFFQLKRAGAFLSQVGWVKADTKAIQAIHDHVITHNPRVSVSHLDVSTWNLHIKSITEEDRGG